jgi:hypothetical protein
MDPNLDSWLWPRVLAQTRRERAAVLVDLRRVAAEIDDPELFALLKRAVDALEICEHQLSCVLPPTPGMDTHIADVRRQIKQRMRQQQS